MCQQRTEKCAFRMRFKWACSDKEVIQTAKSELRRRGHLWTSASVFGETHSAVCPRFLFHQHTHKNTCTKWFTPPFAHFTCTKQTQGTSGYWILTMKLQRLHSNGGDEVKSWDGNHKLIPLTWQATRPWLLPNLPPLKSERHLKKEILDLLLIAGQRIATTERETHTICLILFWCDYCMQPQPCNLHVQQHL